MGTVKAEVRVAAPRERVWDVASRRFGEIASFVPQIAHAECDATEGRLGASRVCTADKRASGFGGKVIERIDRWDEGRYVRIVQDKPVFPLRSGASEVWLADDGTATRLAWAFHYSLRAPFNWLLPLMRGRIERETKKGVYALVRYIETGRRLTIEEFKRLNAQIDWKRWGTASQERGIGEAESTPIKG